MGYLRTHWQGQQSLAWSFWINFALLFVLISLLAQLISPPFVERAPVFLLFAGAYIFLGCLAVFPWQLIGLLRACDRYLADNRKTGWAAAIQRVTIIQGAMVASLAVSLVTIFSLIQEGIHLSSPKQPALADGPGYVIEVTAGGRLLHLEGNFETGLTRNLRALLEKNHGIEGIVLSSDGGRVFEARGAARLIGEHQLETYVYDMCRSACTTAFIAGVKRYLGENGRLGFHQYRLQSVLPTIDVAAEQEKDRAFFQANGVATALLDKVFAEPHESMWYPDMDELLEAKVVHRIVADETRQIR